MEKELPTGKFSASLLEMSGGVEASGLLKSTPDLDFLDGWKPEPSKAQSSATVSEGGRWCEAYCLTLRVTNNVGPMAASENLEVPPHSWSEGTARDITE